MAMSRRALASVARRLGRPELLAAFYPRARELLREEIAIKAVLAGILRGEEIYVDVGTNRGQLLREAIRLAPGARHVAFEPVPELAAELRAAFPQVDCRQVALSRDTGVAEFCHFRTMDGWSGLRRSPEISDERGDPQYIEVTLSTLDLELADLTPRLIKIDVEGAELDVVEGAAAVLGRCRPFVIFEHVPAAAALYGAPPAGIWVLLTDLDYEIFSITGDGPLTRAAFEARAETVNWLARPAV